MSESVVWSVETPWPLRFVEEDQGLRMVEGAGDGRSGALSRWSDPTTAWGAPHDDLVLRGRKVPWKLRVFHGARILCLAGLPEGVRVDGPAGWWRSEEPAVPDWPFAFGAPETRPADLERCEAYWTRSPDGEEAWIRDWSQWRSEVGDTEALHRAGCRDDLRVQEAFRALRDDPSGWVLDGRALISDLGEEALVDLFLFLGQAYGARWLGFEAPPSPALERALLRARADLQGDLGVVWRGEPLPARRAWKRLGPVLPDRTRGGGIATATFAGP